MVNEKLLTRSEYQIKVFKRDGNKCVFCDKNAVDAHHILDRKLWTNGGYYLSNGASVCEEHHWDCEKTIFSVEEVRQASKITKYILPDGFSYNTIYDKWGNEILANGFRKQGVLFRDDGVQKILKKAGFLYLFYY